METKVWQTFGREEADAYSQIGTKKREILWMNFEPVKQMSLFGEEMWVKRGG